ncbi:thiopeptide-type bacteriocin biosynthesis protein [Chryseobacterium sp. C-71]|uniref:thiopeptide-type bacteriocin biosynthesis protein n=1 Tax=Chryseobacterium sp. C-71 TaxID=2893882 RepID=UPI001E318030|nr:thiopeptide-type bacteriocin biosynthesis protein [Chryseobacterium sp. C-71]UFH32320.1 thiopeptide-type bacteriocin biosynthesis protein [Chryseobacterium sp. C-71]
MQIRKFSLKSEWLFFKIYCGVKMSDFLLNDVIHPLIYDLRKKNMIEKWFFIRYSDPRPHLRLRIQLKEVENYQKTFDMITAIFKEYIDSREIENIVLDSYERELERYGHNTTELAEVLFCNSSDLVLNFLDYDDEEKIIVSMFYIENFLEEIDLTKEQQSELINCSNLAFKKEFHADKSLNLQLKQKFSVFKSKYEEFKKSSEFTEVRTLIMGSITKSKATIGTAADFDSFFSFMISVFHMHLNRSFVSNQRVFEMIVYDYLQRCFMLNVSNEKKHKYDGKVLDISVLGY